MPNPVVHFEVNGSDTAALAGFFTSVFGWEIQPIEGFEYRVIHTNAGGIDGGIGKAQDPAQAGVTVYVEVDSPAAYLQRVEAAGGRVIMPETDMGMVVIGLFTDPEGNAVGVVKRGESRDEHKQAGEGAIGHFEIIGRDGAKLQQFYREVFGWTINAENSMNYGLVDTGAGGINGGIGSGDGSTLVTVYALVADLDATLRKVEAAGGKVVMPPTEIPNMVTFAQYTTPEGHLLGLVKSI